MAKSELPASNAPRLAPREGWTTLFVGVAMMLLLGLVIDPDNGVVEARTLGLVTALGYLAGFMLAKTRLPDLLAHIISIGAGVVAAIVAVDPRYTVDAVQGLHFGDLLRRNWDRVEVLVGSFDTGGRLPDDVAQIAISLTIWLVGYSSAWMLFRRGWLIWSLFLPATIFLTSLALDREQPSWPALAFTGLAIVQSARYTTYTRAGVWQRRGLRMPRALGRWSAIAGVALSAAVVFAGIGAPLTVPDDTQEWVVARSQSAADAIVEQLDRLPTQDGDSAPEGNYWQFSDGFRIGEGVPSGDKPVALLRAAEPGYLAALKYDDYDGASWSSSFDMIPGSGSDIQPPRITFSADQQMNLPEGVVSNRTNQSGVITLYQPGGGLILTLETHESASIPTTARVGWQPVDETFVVDDVAMTDVPVDLRQLIGFLKLAQFESDADDPANVRPADSSVQSLVTDEREDLLEYPVETTLTYDENLGVIVTAKGRLPVYEDVEAVFYFGEGEQPATYSVIGLAPNLTVDDLRGSSQDYSDYIVSRYLELPESVTLRTSQLAEQIVAEAGATTPVDMAFAIQEYLRTNYEYLLESSLAPDGQDLVDYFLFDRQIGRCDHFASSMIVMLRSLGVPARIVTGYAPAAYDEASSGYLYRTQDVHAWVEVYFPEFGWVPFEPTPSQSPIELTETIGEPGQMPGSQPTPTAGAPAEAEAEAEPTAEPSPVAAVTVDNSDSGSGLLEQSTSFPGVALLGLLIVALIAGILVAVWLIPLRGLRPGASYFMRFQRLARFWGVEQDTSMTPAEYARIYGSANPRFATAATSIADAFIDERYGPAERENTVASRALQGWLELRKSVATWRPWRRRRQDTT